MSIQEILQAIHDLTNQFQVVLSAIELVELASLSPETRKHIRMAKSEIKMAMITMRHIQSITRAMVEEARDRDKEEIK